MFFHVAMGFNTFSEGVKTRCKGCFSPSGGCFSTLFLAKKCFFLLRWVFFYVAGGDREEASRLAVHMGSGVLCAAGGSDVVGVVVRWAVWRGSLLVRGSVGGSVGGGQMFGGSMGGERGGARLGGC